MSLHDEIIPAPRIPTQLSPPHSMDTLTFPQSSAETFAEKTELTPIEREQLVDLRTEFGHQMNGTVFGNEQQEIEIYWEIFDRNTIHLAHLGLSRANRLHHYKMLSHHTGD